jgi:hypothetical protein
MSYLQIENFKNGLDRRRPRVAGPSGTCWTLTNAHISRGGDIERCLKFVPTFTLPTGTKGLAAVGSQLYVFGAGARPAGLSGLINYQQLAPPGAGTLAQVLDYTVFRSKLYVVAQFTNGDISHYYDGARVTDWDAVADANTSFSALAAFMASLVDADQTVLTNAAGQTFYVTAKEPGVPFTLTVAGSGSGTITATVVQPNISEVQEARATATITIAGGIDGTDNSISSVKAGATELIAAPLPWRSTNEATAARLQAAITARASTTGYDATVAGAIVTIRPAPGIGATANGTALTVVAGTEIQTTHSATFTGGVSYVAPQEQIVRVDFGGTFTATDAYTVTLNGAAFPATGRAAGTGLTCWTFKTRVWSTSRTLLRYCMLNNPSVWNPANTIQDNDAGAVDTSAQNGGQEDLTTAVEYNGRSVIFSRNYGRVWDLATDPTNNAFVQTIENSGTIAPRSAISYGNTDVFYLSETGVRSIRARMATDTAAVSDVGTAIDTYISDFLKTLPGSAAQRAVSVIEPKEGRFWLGISNTIFVLSYFPTPGISAWSTYELPFEVEDLVRVENYVYARGDDEKIYLYGGRTGDIYPEDDELPITVGLPFASAQRPADIKRLYGLDMACENEWAVDILVDPNNEQKRVKGGKVVGTTYNLPANTTPGMTALFAFEMRCTRGGKASISSLALHYKSTEPPQ